MPLARRGRDHEVELPALYVQGHDVQHGVLQGPLRLNFWKAELLMAADEVNREAMGHFGKITSIKDLPPKSADGLHQASHEAQ
jgi:hypothetical protein